MRIFQSGWVFIFALSLTFEARADPMPNVILVTLDGVRWREVFHGTDPSLDGGTMAQGGIRQNILFKNLLDEATRAGYIGGDREPTSGPPVPLNISNPYAFSLPGYQSIFGGYSPIFTVNNHFGRILCETFPERLVRELLWKKKDVASFASWEVMPHAIESKMGETFVNAGLDISPFSDEETLQLNREQALFTPLWKEGRLDRYTWAHALRYLKKERPRFLFIGLGDSDGWSHLGRYRSYIKTLQQYDQWIGDLFQLLRELGEYGRATTVLITTDHGRGPSYTRWPSLTGDWRDHGWTHSESRQIWFYGKKMSSLKQGTLKSKNIHLDLRPTIEKIFTLPERTTCRFMGRGEVIQDLID